MCIFFFLAQCMGHIQDFNPCPKTEVSKFGEDILTNKACGLETRQWAVDWGELLQKHGVGNPGIREGIS